MTAVWKRSRCKILSHHIIKHCAVFFRSDQHSNSCICYCKQPSSHSPTNRDSCAVLTQGSAPLMRIIVKRTGLFVILYKMSILSFYIILNRHVEGLGLMMKKIREMKKAQQLSGAWGDSLHYQHHKYDFLMHRFNRDWLFVILYNKWILFIDSTL